MLRWHMTFERKLVEQSVLPALTFPHHRQHSNPPDRIESPPPCPDNSRFFQHNRRRAAPRLRRGNVAFPRTEPFDTQGLIAVEICRAPTLPAWSTERRVVPNG